MIENPNTLSKARDGSNGHVERKHTWEMLDSAELRRASHDIISKLDMMEVPPERAEDREFYGAELIAWLRSQFIVEEKLSDTDITLWDAVPKRIAVGDQKTRLENAVGLKINRAFDFYLTKQAGLWAVWKLLMSSQILSRVAQWELNDVEMLVRWNRNVETHAKALQGKPGGWLPITGEQIREIQGLLLPDLQILFTRARNEFRERRSKCTSEQFAEFAHKEVSDHPLSYPKFAHYLQMMIAFIKSRPDEEARQILDGRLRPERFLYKLLETTTHYSRRQLIRLKNRH